SSEAVTKTLCSQWWPAADRPSIHATATTPSRPTARPGMRSSTPAAVSGELSGIGALHRSPRSAEWFTTIAPPPFSRQAKYKRSRNELLDVSAERGEAERRGWPARVIDAQRYRERVPGIAR